MVEIPEMGIEKFLANELAKAPFNLDFTVASFSNLRSENMIQLLTLIMAEIDPEQKTVDMSNEDEQATLLRALEFLRIVKYSPPNDNPQLVRQGILNGDPDFLVPVMAWLLSRKDDLKIRAYLAKYLVKITLPDDDWVQDDDIAITYNKYEELLEEFKITHKESLKCQSIGSNTAPLLDDIQHVEHDIECLQSKLDGIRYRMNEGGENQKPAMLHSVHDYRIATYKSHEFLAQEKNEEETYAELEVHKSELESAYLEASNQNHEMTSGEEFLYRLMEETDRLMTLVVEKGPQDSDILRRKIHALELVEEQPPGSQHDMNYLKNKVGHVNEEIKNLTLRKHVKSSSQELFVLRQKASALRSQKLKLAAQVKPVHQKLSSLKFNIDSIILERSLRCQENALQEEEFQKYVNYVTNKNQKFKLSQNELFVLQKEVGVLSSTKFFVDGQWRESEKELEELEIELGLCGFYDDPEKLEDFTCGKYSSPDHEEKKQYLYDMTTNVKQLIENIKVKKENLEPLLNAVNHQRQLVSLLEMDYETKKQAYLGICSCYDSGNKEIQLKIDSKAKVIEDSQFTYVQLKCLLAQLNVTRFRVTEEKVSQSLSFRGFRDKLMVKIMEQERLQTKLGKEKAQVKELESYSTNQKQLWRNVVKLLQWKQKLLEMETADESEFSSIIM